MILIDMTVPLLYDYSLFLIVIFCMLTMHSRFQQWMTLDSEPAAALFHLNNDYGIVQGFSVLDL